MIRVTGHFLWRLLRISTGFALLIAGIILSVPLVPGPGLLLVLLALGILSRDFHWAERIRLYLHNKWHKLRDRQGNIDQTSDKGESPWMKKIASAQNCKRKDELTKTATLHNAIEKLWKN